MDLASINLGLNQKTDAGDLDLLALPSSAILPSRKHQTCHKLLTTAVNFSHCDVLTVSSGVGQNCQLSSTKQSIRCSDISSIPILLASSSRWMRARAAFASSIKVSACICSNRCRVYYSSITVGWDGPVFQYRLLCLEPSRNKQGVLTILHIIYGNLIAPDWGWSWWRVGVNLDLPVHQITWLPVGMVVSSKKLKLRNGKISSSPLALT